MTSRRIPTPLAALALAGALTACDDGAVAPEDAFRLEVVSGQAQSGLEGRALPEPVVLRLVDDGGFGVPNVAVELFASAGGSVSPRVAVTSPTGRVETRWTLGPAATAATQELRALPDDGSGAVTVTARALPESEADVVLLQGALGPLKGITLTRDRRQVMDVVHEVVTPDTLILLQPREDRTGLVVFPTANAVEWRDVTWTPEPDTVRIALRPPVKVDALIRVYVAPFGERKAVAQADLAAVADVWDRRNMGISLGDVTILDRVEEGRIVASTVGAPCNTAAQEHLELSYMHTVRGSASAGEACAPGQVFMGAAASERYPLLAAHEIGHTFALRHRTPGMMDPRNPTDDVTEGEIFRANFDERSGLNVLFDAQPEEARRDCVVTLDPCLDASYRLGG